MPEQPKNKSGNRSRLKAILASPYLLPSAAILPTILTYLLQRRIQPRATPGAEALAQRIREKGIGLTLNPSQTGKLNPLHALPRYGTPHVGSPKAIPEDVGTIVYPFPKEQAPAGRPAIGNAPMFAGSISKLKEIEHLRATAGGHAAPYSAPAAGYMDEMLNALPPEARLEALSQRFAARHSSQGYVIKPIVTKGRTEPLHSGHNLTEEYNKLFGYDWAEPRPEWDEMAGLVAEHTGLPKRAMNLASAINRLKDARQPMDLALMLEKAPRDMQKPLMAYALAHVPETMFVQDFVPSISEYRMHVYDGRILRRSTVPRHDKLKGMLALAGYKSDFEKKLEDQVEQNILGRMRPEDVKDRMMSLDVAVKPDGTPSVLELNPMGWSGFLAGRGAGTVPAAINMHKWMSELAGQETRPLAAVKALGAGALGAGAAYGAQRLADTQTDS